MLIKICTQLVLNKSSNTINSLNKIICYSGNIGKTPILKFKSNIHACEYRLDSTFITWNHMLTKPLSHKDKYKIMLAQYLFLLVLIPLASNLIM